MNKQQEITRIIFQALTDAADGQKGGRRPTELRNIYAIAAGIGATEAEVDAVVNLFRAKETSFIMPSDNTKLSPDLTLDIAHESLMRNWPQLKDWMQDEVKAAALYKRLNENRAQYETDNENFLRGILLTELEDWRNKPEHNAAWAARYDPPAAAEGPEGKSVYERNIKFLSGSRENVEAGRRAAAQLEEERMYTAKVKAQRKRNLWLAVVGFAAAFLSLSFGLYAASQKSVAIRQTKIAEEQAAVARKALKSAEIASLGEKMARDSTVALIRHQALLNERIAIEKSKAEKLAAVRTATAVAAAESKAKIEAATASEAAQNAVLVHARTDILNQVIGEPIFSLKNSDTAWVNNCLDTFFNLKYGKKGSTGAHYADTAESFLAAASLMAKARDILPESPAISLFYANKAYQLSGNALLDVGLQPIVNTLWFDTKTIDLPNNSGSKPDIKFSPDRRLFAWNGGDSVLIGRFGDNTITVNTLPQYTGLFLTTGVSMRFDNANNLCVIVNDKLYRWDVSSPQNFHQIQQPVTIFDTTSTVRLGTVMDISPDAKSVALYNPARQTLEVRNMDKGDTMAFNLRDYRLTLSKCSFTDDGTKLIITGDTNSYYGNRSRTLIFSRANGQLLKYYNGTVKFSGDYLTNVSGDTLSIYKGENARSNQFSLRQFTRSDGYIRPDALSDVSIFSNGKSMIMQTPLNSAYTFGSESWASYAHSVNNTLLNFDGGQGMYNNERLLIQHFKSNVYQIDDNHLIETKPSYAISNYKNYISLRQLFITTGPVRERLAQLNGQVPHIPLLRLITARIIPFNDSVVNNAKTDAELTDLATYLLDRQYQYSIPEYQHPLLTLSVKLAEKGKPAYLQTYKEKFLYYHSSFGAGDYIDDLKTVIEAESKALPKGHNSDSIVAADYYWLSTYEIKTARYNDAIGSAKKGLLLDTGNFQIWYNLVNAYLHNGDPEKARAASLEGSGNGKYGLSLYIQLRLKQDLDDAEWPTNDLTDKAKALLKFLEERK